MSGRPQLWLLTGGNGAGKSTFYKLFLEQRGLPFVNADLIARRLDAANAEARSYDAARIAERLRSDLLREGGSFCFETVFSHPSKIDFAADARARGYELILIYIHLDSIELNQARVAQRVSEGGHSVPPEKVASRLPRTLENVRTALPLADWAQLYDNSSRDHPFRPVARLHAGALRPEADPLPPWARQLLSDHLKPLSDPAGR